jgi:hypothetical protein
MNGRRLDHQDSEKVVSDAIEAVLHRRPLSQHYTLHDLLPTPEMREAVRHRIVHNLDTLRFSIDPGLIDLKPERTVHELTVSLTGLAGDADVNDK